ncbi:MAG: hypothetical protein QXG10_03740 [Candidatus Hadarchaeales archaeon]
MPRLEAGEASICVGALMISLCAVYVALTYFNILPEQQWIFPWLTNYAICCILLVAGLLLLEYGIYHRFVVRRYAASVKKMEEATVESEERLRQREMELHLIRNRLRSTERKVERKGRQIRRVSGRLGDRTRRLKEIERLARIRKRR